MDMETIKRKVLEDVDPEIKRQKKREVRIQRLIGTVQFLAIVVYKRHSVEYKQGDEEFFVLGDNREISRNSREIGTIKKRDIKGRIIWYLGKL